MPDPNHDWPAAWRAWLKVRFGDDLADERLEAAVAECEAFRALWQPLADADGGDRPLDRVLDTALDNGELPFVHLLPSMREEGN